MISTVAGIVIAVIGVVGSTAWLNRKNLARLTAAQTTESSAKTTEIIDRLAREWLSNLEKELTEVKGELEQERRVRRILVIYVNTLLEFIERHFHRVSEEPPEAPPEILDLIEGVRR